MKRFTMRRSIKTGSTPESLIHVGKAQEGPPKITYFDFDEKHIEEKEIKDVEVFFKYRDTPSVTWVNVCGVYDTEIVKKICDHFMVHHLVQEDIVNTEQRPKIEDCGGYIYIVLKMLLINNKELESKQISIILAKNFVITFQEQDKDVFDPLRKRIREEVGKIRVSGNDFLAYSLVDMIVDNYFNVLEELGEFIESLEEETISNPSPQTSRKMNKLRNEVIYIRKTVWPLREVVNILEKSENKIMRKTTRIYIRDLYDHVIQIIENTETYQEIISSMVQIYVSSINNKMTEVMKILTIFSAIFIPLTFIVGVYGMNFKNMPEVTWEMGYPLIWTVMVAITIIMLIYFKKKKWF